VATPGLGPREAITCRTALQYDMPVGLDVSICVVFGACIKTGHLEYTALWVPSQFEHLGDSACVNMTYSTNRTSKEVLFTIILLSLE